MESIDIYLNWMNLDIHRNNFCEYDLRKLKIYKYIPKIKILNLI